MNTKNNLSPDALSFLEYLQENSLIEPDDWHFSISASGNSIACTPQLQRNLIRQALVEVNQYKPNFLSPALKKEFNLIRITDGTDLTPTETELKRLKNKLEALSNDHYIKSDIDYLKKNPNYKMENTIISAWMIDIQDIIDFLNGGTIENIYYRVVERRKKFDNS